MFAQFIRHNMEVYMDDMITKCKSLHDHVKQLGVTFNILRKHIKLNPNKFHGMPMGHGNKPRKDQGTSGDAFQREYQRSIEVNW